MASCHAHINTFLVRLHAYYQMYSKASQFPGKGQCLYKRLFVHLLHCTLVSSSSATPTTSSSRAAPTPTTSSRELPPPPAAAELPERKQYRRGHRTTTTTQRYVMACCIALALKSYRKMCMQHVYSTHVRDLPFTSHVKHAW